MRIAVGADHAGFDLKELVVGCLAARGHLVSDLGAASASEPVDYPDVAAEVGRRVASGQVDLGVCVCGTGLGMAMAANKVPGVRAAPVHDVSTARLAREHNHANVVCLGSRTTGGTTALDALEAFLEAQPQHGRHDRRVAKLADMDGVRATDVGRPEGTAVQNGSPGGGPDVGRLAPVGGPR